jgi:cation-transporting ATPase 13A3/4/5
MENKLKSVTKNTITTLNECKIRTIMATGDNTLTAISVGRDCNILNLDHDVFFGDIIEDKLLWKKSNSTQDDFDNNEDADINDYDST